MRTPCIIKAKANTPILLFFVFLPQLIGSESKKQVKTKEYRISARVVYHETSKCHEEEETVNFSGALKIHAVSFGL